MKHPGVFFFASKRALGTRNTLDKALSLQVLFGDDLRTEVKFKFIKFNL